MAARNIIVIGASAGGFEALKKLAAGFPTDWQASVFILWHIAPDMLGVLPQVLSRAGKINAVRPFDGETIAPNRI